MSMTGMEALRTAAPYLSQFRGQIFVVKLGGEVIENAAQLRGVVEQISLLWRLGIFVVVVHGGGSAMDAVSDRLGLKVEKVGGRRITNAETLDAVKMTLAGKVHLDVLSAFRALDLPVVGLTGLDAGLLLASKRPPVEMKDDSGNVRSVDFGFVGDIEAVDSSVIDHLLEGGYIPVIAPVSASPEGQALNTNADSVASALSIALGAEKLIFVLGVPGFLRDKDQPHSLVPFLTLDEVEEAVDSGAASGGMLPKLKAAKEAVEYGVHAAHLIGGMTPDALLIEVFTNEGAGTMIQMGEASESD